MGTGYMHSSASLLTERSRAGEALRLVIWPGIGSEAGARTGLLTPSALFGLTPGQERKPRSPPVRPSPDARFAFRGRRIYFNAEVFHGAAAIRFGSGPEDSIFSRTLTA